MTTTLERQEGLYKPRGACAQIFLCRDSEVLIAGPAGTGKSRACMQKLHLAALANPGMRGLICRKTAQSLSSTALVTWKRDVIFESVRKDNVRYYGGSAQEPVQYKYENGSVITIGGLDKISKIMSAEYDMIYVQECTELDETDWESLTTRLRNWRMSFQQLLGDCNPSAPTHWLKVRCDGKRTTLFESHHEDNPVLFDDEGNITERGADYLAKLDRLTGVRKKRLRDGKWVSAEGAIYDEFNREFHVIEKLPIGDRDCDEFGVPLKWERIWSVDFGYVNPFVLQCWAIDEDERLYLYREIYMTHRTVDDHAREILNIVAPCVDHCGAEETSHSCFNCSVCKIEWKETRPKSVVCDHDAEGRAILERELGLSTQAAYKSVLEGIEAVQVRMKDAGDGKPRVFFLRESLLREDQDLKDSSRPANTLEEIPGYVWKDGKAKDTPVKADDHGCDAMRYVVAEIDLGVRAIYRGFTS